MTFTNGPGAERGYFGPWRVCKRLLYDREKCGTGGSSVSRFQPVVTVWVAGLAAAAATALLGIFCFLSVLQLAMVMSKDKVMLRYSTALVVKLALALAAALLAIVAAALFAVQTDDYKFNFIISWGTAFYLQICSIILNFVLFMLALYDMLFSRRPGGDPTKSANGVDPSGERAVTFGNPGFRDQHGARTNGSRIAMTVSSGRPYSPGSPTRPYSPGSPSTTMSTVTGSVGSVATISTNGSTRSPLRSSLKKPKPKDGLGIQNPGFSGASPTLSRNGSVKKVRIQTHSTAV
ncbi:hypothetical protein B566_EDAN004254 [Ephemera danica]|nr:hypothetical protein B566_EDAN004254 [Ephemera danica]